MCDTTMEQSKPDRSYLRKIKKPAIEKKRRDRINSCLNQLKSILLENIQLNGGTQVSKLDKADILEMTVSHLRQIQHQQLSVAMATSASVANQFQEGFTECANESVRYMDTTRVYPNDMSARLQRHLLYAAVQRTPSTHQDRISRSTPNNDASRRTAVRSLKFDTKTSQHITNAYKMTQQCSSAYAPVQVVTPVKREPEDTYDVRDKCTSPDLQDSVELGGEAGTISNTVSRSAANIKGDKDIFIKESEILADYFHAIPPRVPVRISPPQPLNQSVWRPF